MITYDEYKTFTTQQVVIRQNNNEIFNPNDLNELEKKLISKLVEETGVDYYLVRRTYIYDYWSKSQNRKRFSGCMWTVINKHYFDSPYILSESEREIFNGVQLKEFLKANPQYDYKVVQKYRHPGVYCITIDNKVLYVGQAKDMHKRLNQHIEHIKNPDEKKYRILAEFRKHNIQIRFDVLDYCEEADLRDKESYWINYYLPPLNKQIPEHRGFP